MTTTIDLKTVLEPVLKQIKRESFVETYQASDEEVLGLLLSKYFEWDGGAILNTSGHALEDANFHTEAAVVRELFDKVNKA